MWGWTKAQQAQAIGDPRLEEEERKLESLLQSGRATGEIYLALLAMKDQYKKEEEEAKLSAYHQTQDQLYRQRAHEGMVVVAFVAPAMAVAGLVFGAGWAPAGFFAGAMLARFGISRLMTKLTQAIVDRAFKPEQALYQALDNKVDTQIARIMSVDVLMLAAQIKAADVGGLSPSALASLQEVFARAASAEGEAEAMHKGVEVAVILQQSPLRLKAQKR